MVKIIHGSWVRLNSIDLNPTRVPQRLDYPLDYPSHKIANEKLTTSEQIYKSVRTGGTERLSDFLQIKPFLYYIPISIFLRGATQLEGGGGVAF